MNLRAVKRDRFSSWSDPADRSWYNPSPAWTDPALIEQFLNTVSFIDIESSTNNHQTIYTE